MIISHSKKFIFVHIYKTGGTSVTSLFLPYARLVEKISGYYWFSRKSISLLNRIFNLNDNGNKWINGVHKHASACEIKKYIGKQKFDSFFKFAFVRNPFDWQVSLYHYIKQSKGHRDFSVANKMSFKDFVLREIDNQAPLQSDFLTDKKGDIIVDFIGYTEDVNKSLKYISDKLNINYYDPPILNKSKRKMDYREYYTDNLRQKVYEYYKKDFELFGYSELL